MVIKLRFGGGLTPVSRNAGAKIRRWVNVGKGLLLLVSDGAELGLIGMV